jgi:hypothetical protein
MISSRLQISNQMRPSNYWPFILLAILCSRCACTPDTPEAIVEKAFHCASYGGTMKPFSIFATRELYETYRTDKMGLVGYVREDYDEAIWRFEFEEKGLKQAFEVLGLKGKQVGYTSFRFEPLLEPYKQKEDFYRFCIASPHQDYCFNMWIWPYKGRLYLASMNFDKKASDLLLPQLKATFGNENDE